MRILTAASAVVCAALFITPAYAASPQYSVTIEIPSHADLGKDIPVTVTLTNISNTEISVTLTGYDVEENFKIDVSDLYGRPAAKTSYYAVYRHETKDPPDAIRTGGGIVWEVKLQSGEKIVEKTLLNKLYILDHPGSYLMRATHRHDDGVVSNQAELMVK